MRFRRPIQQSGARKWTAAVRRVSSDVRSRRCCRPSSGARRGGTAAGCRAAFCGCALHGAPRRGLPEHRGPWTACCNRFDRGRRKGIRARPAMCRRSAVRASGFAGAQSGQKGPGPLQGSFPRRIGREDPRCGGRRRPADPLRTRPRPGAWRQGCRNPAGGPAAGHRPCGRHGLGRRMNSRPDLALRRRPDHPRPQGRADRPRLRQAVVPIAEPDRTQLRQA